MRMRKKRNLELRMEACDELLLARGKPMQNLKQAAEEYRNLIDYRKIFGNEHSIRLEIGCGNGGFVLAMAQREPDVNFLAVELCSNVIITAMERLQREEIKNVRFLNIPAEILSCYIPKESIETIYLNFSTPLPEKSRERQRLTSPRFLRIYRDLLIDGGKIIQKTDSEEFFDYSLVQYEENGFVVGDITCDLHHSEWAAENVVTEYERHFLEQGKRIYRAVALKTGN